VFGFVACSVAFGVLAADATPAQPLPGHPPMTQKKSTLAKPIKQVDINAASRAELKKLPGIGDAEAAKIIAGRPWLTKADLVTKNVLPEGIYVSIRDRIIAGQSSKPTRKK
jgi:DNA uptake protein ComE-like DNA-binding protein